MPGLRQPSVLRAMTRAVADVSAARAALQELGPRPHHELVDSSRAIVAAAEAGDAGVPEADLEACRAVVRLEETHDAYGAPLQEAEGRLEKAYRSAMERTDLEDEAEGGGPALGGGEGGDAAVQEEVVAVLKGLRALDISRSQLEVIPDADAIGGLDHLEELRLSANSLVSLPDSIGLLSNLKILNVENNRLRALLDTISKCRSLEELDASYNNLTYARSPTSVDLEAIVILNIMDAYMRRPELVGTLLGSVLPSGTVHVRSCFVVPHVESTNEVSLKTEFHHSMYALLRTVNPEEAVVGWFSTGFGLSGRSAFIHEFYSREAHNPIHLSFDMEKDFIKAYTSSQVLLRDSDRAAQFQEIPLGVRMIEVKAGAQASDSFVSYRNNALTRVLEDSLGLGSKVVMLIHISRAESEIAETIRTLKFGVRTAEVQIPCASPGFQHTAQSKMLGDASRNRYLEDGGQTPRTCPLTPVAINLTATKKGRPNK